MSEHRYEGTWKIPNIDNEQEGILFIDKNRGLIRLKLFVIGDDGIGFGHRIKTICPIITGNLIGNNKITWTISSYHSIIRCLTRQQMARESLMFIR